MTYFYPQDPPQLDGDNTLLYVNLSPETVEHVERIIDHARQQNPSVSSNDVLDAIFFHGVKTYHKDYTK